MSTLSQCSYYCRVCGTLNVTDLVSDLVNGCQRYNMKVKECNFSKYKFGVKDFYRGKFRDQLLFPVFVLLFCMLGFSFPSIIFCLQTRWILLYHHYNLVWNDKVEISICSETVMVSH